MVQGWIRVPWVPLPTRHRQFAEWHQNSTAPLICGRKSAVNPRAPLPGTSLRDTEPVCGCCHSVSSGHSSEGSTEQGTNCLRVQSVRFKSQLYLKKTFLWALLPLKTTLQMTLFPLSKIQILFWLLTSELSITLSLPSHFIIFFMKHNFKRWEKTAILVPKPPVGLFQKLRTAGTSPGKATKKRRSLESS